MEVLRWTLLALCPSPRVELKGILKGTLSYRSAIGAGCCNQRRSKATDLQSRRRLFADIKTVGKLASISPEPNPLLQLEESDQATGPPMPHRILSLHTLMARSTRGERIGRHRWLLTLPARSWMGSGTGSISAERIFSRESWCHCGRKGVGGRQNRVDGVCRPERIYGRQSRAEWICRRNWIGRRSRVSTEPLIGGRRLVSTEPLVGGRRLVSTEPLVEGRRLVSTEPLVGGRRLVPTEPLVGGRRLVPADPLVGRRLLVSTSPGVGRLVVG